MLFEQKLKKQKLFAYSVGEKVYQRALFITSIIFLIASIIHGPQFARDTIDYIAGSIIRPPLPCIIFDSVRFLFGKAYACAYLVVQTVGIIGAAYYFTEIFRKSMKITLQYSFIVFIVLLSPIIIGWMGSFMLTEAISYALFLLSFALVLSLINDYSLFKHIILSFLVLSNMLNRPQMLFFYLIYTAVSVYILVRKNGTRKGILLSVVTVAMLAGCYVVIEGGYNYLKHGIFARSDFTGKSQLAASLLYLSDAKDVRLFENKPYYPAMVQIYAEMDEYKLFAKYRHDFDMSYAQYWDSGIRPVGIYRATSSRGDVINWHTLARNLYAQEFGVKFKRNDWLDATAIDYSNSRKWLVMSKNAEDIAITLFKKQWFSYFKLFGSRLKKHFPVFSMMLLLVLLAVFFMRIRPISDFFGLSLFATVANILLVGSCTTLQWRYTFYTDVLIVISALLIVYEFNNRKHSSC